MTSISAQSKQLSKHIEEKLEVIDELIINEDYNLALSKLTDLESYKEYMSSDENRLAIDFKKAEAHYGNNEHSKAMNILLNNLNRINKNEGKFYGRYTNYLGDIFTNEKNYERAVYYYKLGLGYFSYVSDSINVINNNILLAKIYGQNEERDSAIYFYKNAINYPLNKANEDLMSSAMSALSGLLVLNDEYELANEYGKKSLAIKEGQKDTIGKVKVLFNLSGIYYRKGEFEIARDAYLEAYEAIKNLKSADGMDIKKNALYNLAYVNEELKNYRKAYFYLLDATELADSLAQANVVKNISEIEAKYNVAKEAQKTEEEKSKRERAQYFFYGSILLFAILLVLAYIFYRNYRLKQENELDKIVNETQIKIINATIDAKENERKAIAETLHDSVSALLSSANLHLQATKAQLKTGYPQEITKAQTIVNEASVKIRDLSHELISSVLLKFGLAFAVHDMCQKYSNSEISFFSDDDGVKRYEQNFEIKIHNIIEELVNNILKHSKAKNASIILAHRDNNMLSIRMNDDGIGFDAKNAKMKGGLGLSHIDARIKVMKGVFNIVSSKDNGTSIFILVPIVDRDH